MESQKKQIIVIGGGAAGFFAAINLAIFKKEYTITILEKTNKLLSKVKVSGGGRCNVTHHCFDTTELIKNYPRGNKELQQVFSRFNVEHTIAWFKQQGVILKTEDDGRMFPFSNTSQTIVDCFINLSHQLNINIITQCEVTEIEKKNDEFLITTTQQQLKADVIICALGGHAKLSAYSILEKLGHTIDKPIPSLFTFNLPNEELKNELQGVSVPQATLKIFNSKLTYQGPILITHWGLSGPAVLKLSAFAAKEFYDLNYSVSVLVNWVSPKTIIEITESLKLFQKEKHKSLPFSNPQFNLPKRLWEFLCTSSGIDNTKPWAEITNKCIFKLAENLVNSKYKMEGKTTFKEEFVTCGGVNLKEIDFKTMQSKCVTNLFFCGEVLNIDGITGGFNFQSAWSTAWICAKNN